MDIGSAWRDRRVGAAVALGAVGAWAVLAGWWLPRGPLTTGHALWSIVVGLAVGAVAGLGLRSRWSVVAAPAAFAAVFELARLGTDGVTVDGLHASTYGLIALAVGRGFHGLVALLPLALGAAFGAAGARRRRGDGAPAERWRGRIGLVARRGVAVGATVALLALTVGLARPASTDPIVGADGEPIAGSIAELTTVEVDGHDHALMVRGHSVDNPVLLFLAGGPGGSELGAMRNHLSELEEHVTVVTWDQRGTGKSYPELDPTSTFTLQGFVDDTIAITDHLRARFGQDRIHLLGQSWGSTLGVLAVQAAPERYASYIGTGQMVSQLRTDRIFYEDTLAWAGSRGDEALADELRAIAVPPYASILDYEPALAHSVDVYAYDHTPNAEGAGGFSENLFIEEYSLIEQVHLFAGFVETFNLLYPQLQGIDLMQTATELEVPAYFVQGAHEADGRAEPFAAWYAALAAPRKDLVVLENSGHRPLFEQPDEFVDYVVGTVLAETVAGDERR